MAGLYRRGRIWWGRAQRSGIEQRRSLKTADRAIAERRLRQWLADLDAIAWGDKPRRSFDEAAERFIREHLTTLKPRGAERYGTSLKHLAGHFGGKTLDQITRGELAAFEVKRRSEGVTAPTIRRDLACLSSLFTSCEDWEWLDEGRNLVPGFLRRRAKRGLKESPPRTRYLHDAEEDRVLANAAPHVVAAIVLAIDTGLRREEQFSLAWPQIHLARGMIETTTFTKNGRKRFVPISQRAAQMLAQIPRRIDTDYVFVNDGTGTRYWQLNKGLERAAARAGIDDLTWHDLRRTAGCRWLQRDGKSLEEVMLLLGHSSVKVTEKIYAFLDEEKVARSLSEHTETGTEQSDIPAVSSKSQKVA